MPGSPGGVGVFDADDVVTATTTTTTTAAATTDDADLLSKLSDVAAAEESAAERRERFKRSRDTWRRRTQPVTPDEIQQANRCVRRVRALI